MSTKTKYRRPDLPACADEIGGTLHPFYDLFVEGDTIRIREKASGVDIAVVEAIGVSEAPYAIAAADDSSGKCARAKTIDEVAWFMRQAWAASAIAVHLETEMGDLDHIIDWSSLYTQFQLKVRQYHDGKEYLYIIHLFEDSQQTYVMHAYEGSAFVPEVLSFRASMVMRDPEFNQVGQVASQLAAMIQEPAFVRPARKGGSDQAPQAQAA